MGGKKTETVQIRMTGEEKSRVNEAARGAGERVAPWVRRVLAAAIDASRAPR